MVCCLADAIAMGVMVIDDGSREFQDGEWVMAFGRARATPEPQPVTDLGGAGEVPFAMVYDKAVFVAEAVGTDRTTAISLRLRTAAFRQ